jgi:hypothetical protein
MSTPCNNNEKPSAPLATNPGPTFSDTEMELYPVGFLDPDFADMKVAGFPKVNNVAPGASAKAAGFPRLDTVAPGASSKNSGGKPMPIPVLPPGNAFPMYPGLPQKHQTLFGQGFLTDDELVGFMLAVRNGDIQEFQCCLKQIHTFMPWCTEAQLLVDIREPNGSGNTVLHMSCANGDRGKWILSPTCA